MDKKTLKFCFRVQQQSLLVKASCGRLELKPNMSHHQKGGEREREYLFFFEYAGELRIIVLRRRNIPNTKHHIPPWTRMGVMVRR